MHHDACRRTTLQILSLELPILLYWQNSVLGSGRRKIICRNEWNCMTDKPQTPDSPVAEPATINHPSPWNARGEQLREQEWDTSQKLIRAAVILLERIRKRPGQEASFAEITRMLDLASRLGRLATGLETEKTEVTGRVDVAFRLELASALKKVYGAPAPKELPPPPQNRSSRGNEAH